MATSGSKVSMINCDCDFPRMMGSSHRRSRGVSRGVSLLVMMSRLSVERGKTDKQRSEVKSYLGTEQHKFVRDIANLRQKPAENGFPGKHGKETMAGHIGCQNGLHTVVLRLCSGSARA